MTFELVSLWACSFYYGHIANLRNRILYIDQLGMKHALVSDGLRKRSETTHFVFLFVLQHAVCKMPAKKVINFQAIQACFLLRKKTVIS